MDEPIRNRGTSLIGFLTVFFRELYAVFLEASPYILLGFTVAAGIQILLPVSIIQRFLGQGRARPIFAASVLGIPLPLCSCSVLPTALALRKRGASRGATVSFLVSTPETGVDSIALTYGLMDPLMATFRPFAALVSALTAGFATEAFGGKEPEDADESAAPACEKCGPEADVASCEKCGPEEAAPAATDHAPGGAHVHDKFAAEEASGLRKLPWTQRLRAGFRGAFVEIFDETSHWMFAGLIISALIAVFLPAEIVTRYLSAGPVPLLLMLVIGIPLYICASASTPIAAALVLKGLSPGAALVFLLAGPATNIGSLAILSKLLGRRVMVVYLTTIAVLSLGLGALLDVIYQAFSVDATAKATAMSHLPLWISGTAALIFAGLLFFSFRRTAAPSEFRSIGRGIESLLGFRISGRTLGRVALAAAALWVLSQCVLVVPPGHRGLIQRFGALSGGALGEGLHLKFPPPIDRAEIVHIDGVRRIELGFRSPGVGSGAPAVSPENPRMLEEESLFLTGDENLVDAKSVVQYRILDPIRYRYGFDDPEAVIRWEAVAELLEIVAALRIDGLYTTDRSVVEEQMLRGLATRFAKLDLGVEPLRFAILDVHAPPEVHAAFRDVASAQEDKQTAVNVALRYQVETVNLARGEAAREVEVARSFADAETRRANGGSQSLVLRSEAFRKHPVGNRTRAYLETMEEILAGSRKVIRPAWKGSGGVDLWISPREGTPMPLGDILRGSEIRQAERTPAGGE